MWYFHNKSKYTQCSKLVTSVQFHAYICCKMFLTYLSMHSNLGGMADAAECGGAECGVSVQPFF